MKEIIGANLSSEMVKLLIDNTPVAYIILDDQYRIHYINENFLKLRSLDLENTIGEVCYNISNGGIHCNQCAVEQALETGKKAFVSRKDTMPDGSVRFIDDYAIPLYSSEETDTQYVLEIMVNRTQEMVGRERRDADYDEILAILSSLVEAKDIYTATHSQSVREIAHRLAHSMQLSASEIFDISIAASLHDIGKVKIPYAIINKPDKLTNEEFDIIKKHPAISFDMLSDLSSFADIKNIVRHHHERVDGRGYPDGLVGEDISLGAKIVAVADTYDAITSTRSYRKALSHEYALAEISKAAGTQLDKEVVEALLLMDFNADTNAPSILDGEIPPVERVIGEQSVKTVAKQIKSGDFHKVIDEERLLNEIFENTPCGYVLMDINRTVLFASNYFLDYMGLTEAEVIGRACYLAGGIGGKPCDPCAIEAALKSGKVEYMRQDQNTNNGNKIFDLFGMPLVGKDGKIEYVIEVIIDRTEEISLERRRESDFAKLIEMLGDFTPDATDSDGEAGQLQKIKQLHQRLDNLLTNNPLI